MRTSHIDARDRQTKRQTDSQTKRQTGRLKTNIMLDETCRLIRHKETHGHTETDIRY
jgi:hypothetical protein